MVLLKEVREMEVEIGSGVGRKRRGELEEQQRAKTLKLAVFTRLRICLGMSRDSPSAEGDWKSNDE